MNETVSAVDDELEQLVLSFRLLLRIGETHPQSAQIAARSLVAGPIDFGLFTNDVGQRVMRLVATGADGTAGNSTPLVMTRLPVPVMATATKTPSA